jgi:hypothetical protein
MPVRKSHAQPLAARATAVRARHVRRGPSLINEDKPRRVEVLRVDPGLSGLQDVGPVLLDRVAGLFLRVSPWRTKNRESAEVEVATPRAAAGCEALRGFDRVPPPAPR